MLFGKCMLLVCAEDDSHRTLVLCILYHISIEEKSRPVFAYTDCVPQVNKHIICTSSLPMMWYTPCTAVRYSEWTMTVDKFILYVLTA